MTLVCRWSAAVAACLTYSANVNINLFTAITPPKYGSNAVTGEAGAFLSLAHLHIITDLTSLGIKIDWSRVCFIKSCILIKIEEVTFLPVYC